MILMRIVYLQFILLDMILMLKVYLPFMIRHDPYAYCLSSIDITRYDTYA